MVLFSSLNYWFWEMLVEIWPAFWWLWCVFCVLFPVFLLYRYGHQSGRRLTPSRMLTKISRGHFGVREKELNKTLWLWSCFKQPLIFVCLLEYLLLMVNCNPQCFWKKKLQCFQGCADKTTYTENASCWVCFVLSLLAIMLNVRYSIADGARLPSHGQEGELKKNSRVFFSWWITILPAGLKNNNHRIDFSTIFCMT